MKGKNNKKENENKRTTKNEKNEKVKKGKKEREKKSNKKPSHFATTTFIYERRGIIGAESPVRLSAPLPLAP